MPHTPDSEAWLDPASLSNHARANREYWNRESDDYQGRNGPMLEASGGMAWGVWQIPESELRMLGDVTGKDILELGCGAAQWSIALAAAGARPVGLDVSEAQLAHARALMATKGIEVPLLHASAENLPLPASSFDIVFCDWGATNFCDPDLVVPQVARVLRPSGLFVFSGSTPTFEMCYAEATELPGDRLLRDYFGMKRIDWDDGTFEFTLPYGDWIRLFRRHGFLIEDLVELRPDSDAVSTYVGDEERSWARRWPREQIWKLRKET